MRSTKRDYGSGSVYQRKSDGRWIAALRLPDGKRKLAYADTERKAKGALQHLRQQWYRGELVLPSSSTKQITVGSYATEWHVARRHQLAPTTYVTRHYDIARYIVPRLGHIPLGKLSSQQVQEWINALVEEDQLAPSTVRLRFTLLKQICLDALDRGILSKQPCRKILLPKAERSHRPFPPLEQFDRLLTQVQDDWLFCALVPLALFTGLRRGELLGLSWEQINWQAKTLTVCQQAVSICGKGVVLGPLKTESSHRVVPLNERALAALRLQQHRVKERRLQAGSEWQEHHLVFPTHSGKPMEGQHVSTRFTRYLRRHHLPPMHFHELRHAAATLMLAAGVRERVVQSILGHSSLATTLRYLHMLSGMEQEATDRLEALFARPRIQGHS